MQPRNIIFAGTPEISKIVLNKILENGFNVSAVLTQPDRPANRGKKITLSAVKEFALEHNIEVLQPLSLKDNPEVLEKIRLLKADIMVVVAYGLILPKEFLTITKLGCVNIHVSMLPRYRGAAPIQRAILSGDEYTGVTIMQMDTGMDTGAILMQQPVNIAKNETSGSLHDKLAYLGADMIIEYMTNHAKYQPKPQPGIGISYAPKIIKQEASIDWNEAAEIIERKIRGFNPSPGCFTFLENELIKIWSAELLENASSNLHEQCIPGTIISVKDDGIEVMCGKGRLLIKELQFPGGKRLTAKQYINGHPNLIGKVLKKINQI